MWCLQRSSAFGFETGRVRNEGYETMERDPAREANGVKGFLRTGLVRLKVRGVRDSAANGINSVVWCVCVMCVDVYVDDLTFVPLAVWFGCEGVVCVFLLRVIEPVVLC